MLYSQRAGMGLVTPLEGEEFGLSEDWVWGRKWQSPGWECPSNLPAYHSLVLKCLKSGQGWVKKRSGLLLINGQKIWLVSQDDENSYGEASPKGKGLRFFIPQTVMRKAPGRCKRSPSLPSADNPKRGQGRRASAPSLSVNKGSLSPIDNRWKAPCS